jgi:hypothetical protein
MAWLLNLHTRTNLHRGGGNGPFKERKAPTLGRVCISKACFRTPQHLISAEHQYIHQLVVTRMDGRHLNMEGQSDIVRE